MGKYDNDEEPDAPSEESQEVVFEMTMTGRGTIDQSEEILGELNETDKEQLFRVQEGEPELTEYAVKIYNLAGQLLDSKVITKE